MFDYEFTFGGGEIPTYIGYMNRARKYYNSGRIIPWAQTFLNEEGDDCKWGNYVTDRGTFMEFPQNSVIKKVTTNKSTNTLTTTTSVDLSEIMRCDKLCYILSLYSEMQIREECFDMDPTVEYISELTTINVSEGCSDSVDDKITNCNRNNLSAACVEFCTIYCLAFMTPGTTRYDYSKTSTANKRFPRYREDYNKFLV